MAKDSSISITSIFLSALTLIFITLKLTDNIDWSWWLVLSPMIVPLLPFMFLIVLWFVSRIIGNPPKENPKNMSEFLDDYKEKQKKPRRNHSFMARVEASLREQEAKRKGSV